MKEQRTTILIKNVIHYLDEHLNSKENYRILFSGRYGIGKTFFLNEHFKERTDVNTVFISPVNYVVGSNKNIFEYIKFDILVHLYHNNQLQLPEDISIGDLDELTVHFLGLDTEPKKYNFRKFLKFFYKNFDTVFQISKTI